MRRFGFRGSEPLEVVRRAVEVRLQHRSDSVAAGLAQPLVRAKRRVDVLRLLHVDADERAEPPACSTSRSTFAYAVSSSNDRPRCVSLRATFAFSFSATSRSTICSYSAVTAAAPSASVSPRRGVSCSHAGRRRSACAARRRIVERLAGDEASRTHAPAVPLHEMLEARAVGRIQDGRSRERRNGCPEVGQAVPILHRCNVSSGTGRAASREDSERAALPPQHAAPEPVRIVREDVLGERGLDDPRAFVELFVELARPPARIADDTLERGAVRRGGGSTSEGRNPIELDHERSPHRSLSTNSARTTMADGCTGPPTWTAPCGRRESRARVALRRRSTPTTRLRTTPSAPSSECSPTRTTVRRKFGSTSAGPAMSKCPSATPRPYHRRMDGVAREIRLVARPSGFPDEDLFEVAETSIPDPDEGQVLVRNAYFSVDPYMRPRMNDVRSYVAPFTLGEAMTGGAVGRVAVLAESGATPRATGCCTARLARVGALRRLGLSGVDPEVAPISTALGVLGMPGFTAWYGLLEIGTPTEGEIVFVSGAAGAVGSAAGQMARSPAAGSSGAPARRRSSSGFASSASTRVFDYREQSPRACARRAGAGWHRHLLRQRRRRSPRGRDRRAAHARSRRRLRLDVALQRRSSRRRDRATCSWS